MWTFLTAQTRSDKILLSIPDEILPKPRLFKEVCFIGISLPWVYVTSRNKNQHESDVKGIDMDWDWGPKSSHKDRIYLIEFHTASPISDMTKTI